jgi:hypothetical protein
MEMLSDSLRVAIQVTHTLEELGIPYAVGGSLSSSMHGVMRSTLDIDILADVQLVHIPRLLDAFKPDFYTDELMIIDAVVNRSRFNLIHYETAFKVDLFIPKDRDFDRMELERRTPVAVSNQPEQWIYMTSPEDIILSKLEWYRLGNESSDRQWKDILGVLRLRAGELDLVYLRRWAVELAVADLLERALQDA